jgi:hypothetical protein
MKEGATYCNCPERLSWEYDFFDVIRIADNDPRSLVQAFRCKVEYNKSCEQIDGEA